MLKVCELLLPGVICPKSNALLSLIGLCVVESLFVIVTVEPTAIVITLGLNVKLLIVMSFVATGDEVLEDVGLELAE